MAISKATQKIIDDSNALMDRIRKNNNLECPCIKTNNYHATDCPNNRRA